MDIQSIKARRDAYSDSLVTRCCAGHLTFREVDVLSKFYVLDELTEAAAIDILTRLVAQITAEATR